MEAAARMEAAVIVAAREAAVLVAETADAATVTRVGGHRWPLSAIMLTVAGRRGRRVGGELSWGGLEGGEGGDEGVELGYAGLGGGEGGGEGGVLRLAPACISTDDVA